MRRHPQSAPDGSYTSPSSRSTSVDWFGRSRQRNETGRLRHSHRAAPPEEGGGFLVTVPDLPGCVADGETVDAAIAEARDAFKAWAAAEQQDRGALPTPKTYSGQFVQRIPKSLHQRLARRAAAEGESLNQLAATYLAQISRRQRG